MIAPHIVGRSSVMSASLVDRIGGRTSVGGPAFHTLADVAAYVGGLLANIRSLRHQLHISRCRYQKTRKYTTMNINSDVLLAVKI